MLLAAAALVLCLTAPHAQESSDGASGIAQSRAEYERVAREATISAERLEKLTAEIAKVKKDNATVTAALIQSAKTERKLAEDIEDITAKLEKLKAEEAVIRASLNERRGVLAEVLGALQRMGLNPPPAILVKPEDALSSVRSAILLGAVVPELRGQTEILMADLNELSRVAASIEAERGRLQAAVAEQVAEKRRLSMLQAEKQRLQGETETALADERARTRALADKAGNLKDLIAALERTELKRQEAADAARLAEAEKAARDTELAALPVPEGNRLVTAAFPALQGQLAPPVSGRFKRRFGGKDGNGGVMLGDTLATQSGAIVTAPADGSVLYAGPFRSYGQLLILNAGDGYHVVLAGMSRINVVLGQSVLAGEPIGAMTENKVATTAASAGRNEAPELYVEFRKDGKPVDPAPWWADRFSGRT